MFQIQAEFFFYRKNGVQDNLSLTEDIFETHDS